MISHAKAPSAGSTLGGGARAALAGRVSLVALFALLLLPALASAETFGSAAQPSFNRPAGMTVDQASGDLYVIDLREPKPGTSNGTLSRYNPDGTPHNFSALGSNVIDGASGEDATPSGEILSNEEFGEILDFSETEVAVAPPSAGETAGNIYVTNALNEEIDVFAPSGKFLFAQEVPTFPCGVAVDPAGNVFVGDKAGEEGVHKYAPSGPESLSESPGSPFPVSIPCAIAAGEGFVYAANFLSEVNKIDSEGAEEGEKKYTFTSGYATGLSLDPISGHLFVAMLDEFFEPIIREFDVSGAANANSVATVALAGQPHGVAVDGSTGTLYATYEGNPSVEVFDLGTPEFELAASQGGTGTGTVKCKFDGGPAGPCVGSHPGGTEVTLEAAPGPSTELKLSGAGSASSCTSSPCSFNLREDSSVTAEFNLEPDAVAITNLNPSQGPTSGGNTVELTGVNFSGAEAVKFGATAATFTVESPTLIKATAPAGSPGTVDVHVKTPGHESVNLESDNYTYLAQPVVSGLSPSKGPLSGGNQVIITGAEFTGAEAVKFGATAATFTVEGNTQIKATAPACAAGAVHVTVIGPGGTSLTSVADEYTCVAVPAVSSIAPGKGPLAGGNTVTITGTDLADASSVKFGASPATITEDTATQIKVTAPSCAAGSVHITVTTAGGTSTTSAADEYTCVVAPAVTSVSPTKGPLGGGGTVTITGTNLEGAESVKFGASPATITEDTATQIKVTAPSCVAGALHITVTTPGGTSATGAGDEFTCVAAPVISSITPPKGPDEGGNSIEISGTNLSAVTKVEFGTTVVNPPFLSNSATKIKVKVPAHTAGKVDIKVTTVGGTSAPGPADEYTYVAPLALTISKAGSGSGSITCDGGACKATYVFGTKVALAASADAGSSFAGFSGGGCSGTSCTLTLEADTAVTATFTANPPPPSGGGAAPAPAPVPTPAPTPKPLKCKKGFKKKKVHGKAKCVKAKHKTKRHHK